MLAEPKTGESKVSPQKETQPAKKGTVGFLSGVTLPPSGQILSGPPQKKKRPITELLAEYEKRRIEFEKDQ